MNCEEQYVFGTDSLAGSVVIGQGEMGSNGNSGDLDGMQGRGSLEEGRGGTGTSCPERRWMPCPWRHSRSG